MVPEQQQEVLDMVERWIKTGLPADLKVTDEFLIIESGENWRRAITMTSFAKMFADFILSKNVASEKLAEHSKRNGYGLEEDLLKRKGAFAYLEKLKG
jgi:hypothetical protein